MKNTKTNLDPLLIIIAACFWGSMGIFVRKLESFGFSAIQIVSIRLTLAALLFCLVQLIVDRSGFKIALRRYSPYTVTTYTFLFAGLGSWFVCKPGDMFSHFAQAPNLPLLIGFCILTALITAVIVLNKKS